MAGKLSDNDLKKIREIYQTVLKAKTAEFKAQGKNPFREPVDEHGHGPGVMPQNRYDLLRYTTDKYHPSNKKNSKGNK